MKYKSKKEINPVFYFRFGSEKQLNHDAAIIENKKIPTDKSGERREISSIIDEKTWEEVNRCYKN